MQSRTLTDVGPEIDGTEHLDRQVRVHFSDELGAVAGLQVSLLREMSARHRQRCRLERAGWKRGWVGGARK